MANEQEVARSLLQPVKVVFEGDVPTENLVKDCKAKAGRRLITNLEHL